jgi:hypothetical protein
VSSFGSILSVYATVWFFYTVWALFYNRIPYRGVYDPKWIKRLELHYNKSFRKKK